MATLTVAEAAPDFLWWPTAFENDGPDDILSASATELKFTSNAGYVITIAGTGFVLVDGEASGGVVTSIRVRDSADTTVFLRIDGLSTDFADLYDTLFGDGVNNPNALGALELLLNGKDTLIGSNDNGQLGGYSPGNDIVKAKYGNDGVIGDAGNDRLDGGVGYDILSYYLGETAFRGIKLDAAKGTVTDPWGDKDTIENFESFQGSRFADVIKGTNSTHFVEVFYGLDGSDTIDGRGGYDRLIYAYDQTEGGLLGISADLAEGKIKDSWGKTDKVKNIESVAGTAENDGFVGDGESNEFSGLAGVDTFDGGGGLDWVAFWFNDSFGGMHGVEVDLSLASGQIVDDGFGNVESTKSIEYVIGSDFGDFILGSNGANSLVGGAGNDTLKGGKGDDYIDGGEGDDLIEGGDGDDRLVGGSYVDESDTLSYENAASGVTVDLGKRKQVTGGAGIDEVSDFENLIGSAFDDILTGDPHPDGNFVRSGDGADTIYVASGGFFHEDKIDGGEGIDTIFLRGSAQIDFWRGTIVSIEKMIGSKGSDIVEFGISQFIDFHSFDLRDGDNDTIEIRSDRDINLNIGPLLKNVERIVVDDDHGSHTITCSSFSDTIMAGSGDDLIFVVTDDVRDIIDGESDTDIVDYSAYLTGLTFTFTRIAPTLVEGSGTMAGTCDTISSIEVFVGGSGDDKLVLQTLYGLGAFAGGGGEDTIEFAGSGQILSLLSVEISGVEHIDLTGAGDNTLVVEYSALAGGGGPLILVVEGDAGDAFHFGDTQWVFVGTVVRDSVIFDRFVFDDTEVQIEQDVSVNFVVDLTTLTVGNGFIVQGESTFDNTGGSVSFAGDVNGDGFGDVIVASSGKENAGGAVVVFGAAAGFGTIVGGRETIDVSTLSSARGFMVQGDSAGDLAGWDVSLAGDVNGDGFADLIVSAVAGDDGGTDAGEAYIVFGTPTGFGTEIDGTRIISLTTLSAAEGFIAQGGEGGDYAGWSATSAGDINGDGFDDLIVGAEGGDDGGLDAGEAYVVFGTASGFGSDVGGRQVVDLATLSAGQGFVVQGDAAGDNAGFSVSSAGDVNGDGVSDLIVGAPRGADGGQSAGEAYLIFGSSSSPFGASVAGRQVVDLTTLSTALGFIIQGGTGGDFAGRSVSSGGDVNGDGYDDLVIGAPGGSSGGNNAGEAYVVFGGASGFGVEIDGRSVVDLTTLSPDQGFVIQGDSASDVAGCSVSSAGDVNGDGLDDLIVGALRNQHGGVGAGTAYVIFGTTLGLGNDVNGRQVIDLTSISTPGGAPIHGGGFAAAGSSVSGGGDVNGDGFDDLIVGAPDSSDGVFLAGAAYVVFGGAFGGLSTPVNTTGTGADEILIGGRGADTLAGGGGVDVFRGGAGDDAISAPDVAFRSVNGGSGIDTLAFTGVAETIDFATIADNRIKAIEAFDISGTGADTIVIGALDAFHFSDTPHAGFTGADSHNSLVILGDAGDTVELDGFDPDGGGPVAAYEWQLAASGRNLDGSAGGGFDFYNLVRDAKVVASVAVDADMTLLL